MAKGHDRGVLFCAAVGDRTYLRFVRTDASWQALKGDQNNLSIGSELGTCLRIAECEPETPRVVPRSLEEEVILELWETAQLDIREPWMLETDLADLQPKLGRLNRRVAARK